MFDDLIDKIYEAAFVPDLWPAALGDINAASTSVGGAVFLFADGQPVRGRTVPLLQDLLSEFLLGDTLQFSTAVSRMCAVQPASFVDVESFLTAEEIENDPVRVRLRALGIGAHTCPPSRCRAANWRSLCSSERLAKAATTAAASTCSTPCVRPWREPA
ncbi:hypothetical protein [Mesorhizobium sp.]|uniref:hypothetical protein n=1 Tax=Mesorhizobium sp. TaxID=1871066 RepID=UPI0025D20265|nr:hypothetical protein [Mesorhizobium sp.]